LPKADIIKDEAAELRSKQKRRREKRGTRTHVLIHPLNDEKRKEKKPKEIKTKKAHS